MLTSRKKFLQQTGLACAATMLPFSKLFSAELLKPLTVDTSHPKNCNQDLTDPLFPDSFEIKQATFDYHKGTYPGIAKDVLYEKEEQVNACVNTSTFVDKYCGFTNHHKPASNDLCELKYTAFYPISTYEDSTNGHDYDQVPLPLILLFHPGGFAECGIRVPSGIQTLCEQFAKRGYIAIAAGYRLGRARDPYEISTTVHVSVQQQMAPYRGIQDGNGAMRSIFKRNGLANRGGHNFKINPNQFFIGGSSAGGIVAMGVAYYRNQAMINQVFPVTTTSLTIEEALGHINADFYYGETGSDLENPLYTPPIRAVLSCWGGITIPKTFDENGTNPNPDLGKVEKGYFQAVGSEDPDFINPPMIGFIGANDETIPFVDGNIQNVINSTNSMQYQNYYRKENVCLDTSPGSIITKSPGQAPNYTIYTKVASSHNMYYILKELNRFTELYIDCDMAHGLNDDDDNFDVVNQSQDDVFTYIAIRAAIFFQTCMNFVPYPAFGYRGKSLFISTDYDSNVHVINNRICADNCTTTTTTCSTGNDAPCN